MGDERLYVELFFFDIRSDSRSCQAITRNIHSSEQTVLTRVTNPTRESMTLASITPHEDLYTKEFTTLSAPVPFLVSIAGIVSSTSGTSVSTGGVDMMDFKLQNKHDKYVHCKAFGRHASNGLIAISNEIIIYFAAAREGLNSRGPGALWLFDDAHVVKLSTVPTIPTANKLIELRG